MTNPCLLIIESAYDIAINPTLDYEAQLQPLAAAGELANRLSSNKVLFKLCMIVDAQAKEIQALKDDRTAIANKMVELESVQPQGKVENLVVADPTAPLG